MQVFTALVQVALYLSFGILAYTHYTTAIKGSEVREGEVEDA